MRSVVCIMFGLLLFPSALWARDAMDIIWLDKAMPTFRKGLKDMQETLERRKEQTNRILWRVKKLYVTHQEVDYRKEEFKLYVTTKARAAKENNTRDACKTLLSKAKMVIFGKNKKEAVMDYFPSISFDDLMYFIRFEAALDSYAVKDEETGEMIPVEADEDEDDIPEQAKIIKTTECRTGLIGKDVYFN